MSTPPLPEEVSAAPATKLANQLNSMAVHLLRRLRREDVALGVTAARLSALAVLVYGGPQTLRELAGREQVTAPTMTRIVDALVRDGLATRVAGEQDRRSVRIEATKRGRQLMEQGRARRVRRLAADLERLSADEMSVLSRAVGILQGMEEWE